MTNRFRTTSATLALLLGAACSNALGVTIYVNHAATGAGSGASWADAYTDLQAALAAAAPSDEIWVAQGTYRPGNLRTASFALKTSVSVYGGFQGSETARTQRDWAAFPTILSGDLLGNDGPNWANRADNAYHVVVAVGQGACRLDGFTIRGGHADGAALGATPESQDQGSGANVYDSYPHFENIVFEDNYASNHGAVNDHGSSTLVACTFRRNYGGLLGAGLYMHFQSQTLATRCVFTRNETPQEGGGAYTRSYVGARIEDSIFTYNTANFGAGMYNANGSNATVLRSIFSYNVAHTGGAGVTAKFADTLVRECTFTYNVAGPLDDLTGSGGGGGSGGAGFWASGGSPQVVDCVFTNNQATFGAGAYFNDESTGSVLRCTFRDNLANEAAGLYILLSAVMAQECVFERNTATGGQFPVGGGMSAYFSNASAVRCTFDSNVAGLGGGGLYVEGESPLIAGCVFTRNSTTWPDQGWGGGLLNGFHTSARVVNSVFVGNTAQRGGAVANAVFAEPTIVNSTMTQNRSLAPDARGGAVHTMSATPVVVRNSVLWDNAPQDVTGPADLAYSDVGAAFAGPGNLRLDPRFVRAPTPGPDGAWKTGDDDLGDLRPQPGSPLIDRGRNSDLPADVTADVVLQPRRVDDPSMPDAIAGQSPGVDIGASEFQGVSCSADFNGDGDFGTDQDVEAFFACIAGHCCATCATADYNLDGDWGTDQDIESFFRVIAGGGC